LLKENKIKGQKYSFETAEYYKVLKAVTIIFVIRNSFS